MPDRILATHTIGSPVRLVASAPPPLRSTSRLRSSGLPLPLRPPLALHRLSLVDHGGLLYRMKRPRHGSSWLALTPDEFLATLATVVPPPRFHGLRYHGVFAPHAGLRSRVVPEPLAPPAAPQLPPTGLAVRQGERGASAAHLPRPLGRPLGKVFAIDVLACPECGGRLVPQKFIKKMVSFDKRTYAQKDAVLNNPENFQGLPKTFNSSKGGKMPADWTTYKGKPLHPEYIQRNVESQGRLTHLLQQQIGIFLGTE